IVVSDALTHLQAAAQRDEKRPESASAAGLTEREQGRLTCIAGGLSNKQIARELNIAEGTVKVHVKHLLRKLNFRARVEAAVWAVEHMRSER
ncbi:LuxR C-terminal-related transcriptional regulator, partial [Aromatoleum toluclasticum]|uniref:LuxR C-terminal-related transcriptional regulator n=1 Tax=Aromatoleum toluclasticum TaxID=92003 RepID=UPI001D180298